MSINRKVLGLEVFNFTRRFLSRCEKKFNCVEGRENFLQLHFNYDFLKRPIYKRYICHTETPMNTVFLIGSLKVQQKKKSFFLSYLFLNSTFLRNWLKIMFDCHN